MAYQALAKTKLTWEEKVDRFAQQYGPFSTRWDEYRTFTVVEGFLQVYYPRLAGQTPPLIEIDDKPRCACCGSARPMSFRILTDKSGYKPMVGEECYRRLCELHQVTHIDFVSPIPKPNSEDTAG